MPGRRQITIAPHPARDIFKLLCYGTIRRRQFDVRIPPRLTALISRVDRRYMGIEILSQRVQILGHLCRNGGVLSQALATCSRAV
jgi:hypothetical protein